MFFVNLLPGTISEILASVAESRRITKADRFGLMAVVLGDSLSEKKRNAVGRVLRSLVKDRIEVIDDLLAVL